MLLRGIGSLLRHVRKSRSRQEMNRSHHRANQPFDMSSEVRPARRTMLKSDAKFLATTQQRFGMELLGIVDMNRSRQTMDRPIKCLKFPVSQPGILWEHRLG